MEKKYIIYKITNNINNKIYIGKHETFDINDEYMGSGVVLNRSIKKYGLDKFIKEILYIFNNEDDMMKMEADIVNEEFVARLDTYNLTLGGIGGRWHHINNNKELKKEICGKAWKSIEFSDRMRKLLITRHKEGKIKAPDWTGKKHNEESKKKISIANSIYQKGSGNSQYGTCWIYKTGENKKIKKDDLQKYLNDGWTKGRKLTNPLKSMT